MLAGKTPWQPYVRQYVRCVEPDGTWLRKGQVYLIREVWPEMNGGALIGLNKFCGIIWGGGGRGGLSRCVFRGSSAACFVLFLSV